MVSQLVGLLENLFSHPYMATFVWEQTGMSKWNELANNIIHRRKRIKAGMWMFHIITKSLYNINRREKDNCPVLILKKTSFSTLEHSHYSYTSPWFFSCIEIPFPRLSPSLFFTFFSTLFSFTSCWQCNNVASLLLFSFPSSLFVSSSPHIANVIMLLLSFSFSFSLFLILFSSLSSSLSSSLHLILLPFSLSFSLSFFFLPFSLFSFANTKQKQKQSSKNKINNNNNNNNNNN